MKRFPLLVIVLTLLAFGAQVHGQCAAYYPSPTCANHKRLVSAAYPYSEDFASGSITVSQGSCCSSYVTVVEGCAAQNNVNITNFEATHLMMRAWLQIGSASAAAGSEYAVRFRVDNVVRGEYVRKLTGHYPH